MAALLFVGFSLPGAVHGMNATEFPISIPLSDPFGISVGADGNLWFTQSQANQIGRITPLGAFLDEIPLLNAGSGIGDITVGPEGNLWFVEYIGNRIGRITPGGIITEFAIPTPNSGPLGIAAARDGDLWFTELFENKIGKITPEGAFTEVQIPTSKSLPERIVEGPDGNLWFVEFGANQIGRITPSGNITEFALPSPNSSPLGITVGPDDNLWITEFNANQIGKMTTAGVFLEEFPLPTPLSQPNQIILGPDGNLWFTELANTIGRIGRITPEGDIKEFSLPSLSTVMHLTGGPDGNIWFVEGSANRLGKITLPHLSIGSVTQIEPASGSALAVFTVTLSEASADMVTVDFSTSDGTASLGAGDYQAASGTLSFNPGDLSRTLSLEVLSDAEMEPSETANLILSHPHFASLESPSVGVLTISDPPSTNSQNSGSGGCSVLSGPGLKESPFLLFLPFLSLVFLSLGRRRAPY
jgi:streptogramin lyase